MTQSVRRDDRLGSKADTSVRDVRLMQPPSPPRFELPLARTMGVRNHETFYCIDYRVGDRIASGRSDHLAFNDDQHVGQRKDDSRDCYHGHYTTSQACPAPSSSQGSTSSSRDQGAYQGVDDDQPRLNELPRVVRQLAT